MTFTGTPHHTNAEGENVLYTFPVVSRMYAYWPSSTTSLNSVAGLWFPSLLCHSLVKYSLHAGTDLSFCGSFPALLGCSLTTVQRDVKASQHLELKTRPYTVDAIQ